MDAAVIANPHAGALRKHPGLAGHMARLMLGRAQLRVTRDVADVGQVADELSASGCRHVAIVGGDGTASVTLTHIARAYGERPLPTVTLLRGGTMNTVANSLSVPRAGTLALLEAALRSWSSPLAFAARPRPALRIGDRLGFLFGTGVWYGYLLEYYAASRGHPTPLTAIQVLGAGVTSALVGGRTYQRILDRRPLSVRVDGDHTWESRSYMTVCAGTVREAGLGFRLFSRACDRDDRFHLIAVKGAPGRVARDLPRVWFGLGLSADTAYEALACGAEITCHDGGRFGYAVDGDLFETERVLRVGLGPTFRFLIPK